MAGGYFRQVVAERGIAQSIEARQKAEAEQERIRRMGESSPMRAYEAARMGRGKLALAGKYNVATDPQFQAIQAGLEKNQGRTLSDIESASAKGGLGGFSASYLSEKMKETGANTILNLAASMQGRQEELITQGSEAGKNIAGYLAPEWQAEMNLRQGAQAGEYGLTEQAGNLIQAKNAARAQAIGGICCFIFYAGDKFIRAVHMYRDEFYPNEGFVGLGYRLMARWLVPIMKRNNFVKKLVIFIMLDPLAKYAMAHYQRQTWKKFILTPFKLFWTNFWAMYGRTALAYEKAALILGV